VFSIVSDQIFVKIECGDKIWIALNANGEVFVTEKLDQGITMADRESTLQQIIDISAGSVWCAALRNDGNLYFWGKLHQYASANYLCGGNGFIPQLVSYLQKEVNFVNLGWIHGTAILSNGSVWAWGDGDTNRLGLYPTRHTTIPMKVPFPSDTRIIETSPTRGCEMALSEDGRVFIWGGMEYGGFFVHKNPTLIDPNSWAYDLTFDGKPINISASYCYCSVLTARPITLKLICIKVIAANASLYQNISILPTELQQLVELQYKRYKL